MKPSEHYTLTTATDGSFDLVNAPWTQVNIVDIAWGLSQLNRYLGQASRPYSVAEHSLLVMQIARDQLGLDAHGQMAALMHDAHEIYCADLHPGVKSLLGPAWEQLEALYERSVRTAFGLHTAFGVHGEAIKRADQIALATELRDLKGASVEHWGARNGVPCAAGISLEATWRVVATWQHWRDTFLQSFHKLEEQRTALMRQSLSTGLFLN